MVRIFVIFCLLQYNGRYDNHWSSCSFILKWHNSCFPIFEKCSAASALNRPTHSFLENLVAVINLFLVVPNCNQFVINSSFICLDLEKSEATPHRIVRETATVMNSTFLVINVLKILTNCECSFRYMKLLRRQVSYDKKDLFQQGFPHFQKLYTTDAECSVFAYHDWSYRAESLKPKFTKSLVSRYLSQLSKLWTLLSVGAINAPTEIETIPLQMIGAVYTT